MSRVIQITVSPSGSLFALTDGGDIYVTDHRSPWQKVDGPIPPRFSLPEEYAPPLPPLPPLDRGAFTGCGSYAAAKQSESRLFRRPTSIGSDGNYIPQLGD